MSLMNLLLASTCKASDNKTLPTLLVKKAAGHHIKVTGFRSLFIFLWNTLVAVVMLMLTTMFLKDTQTPLTGSPGIENKPRRFVRTSVSLDDIKMVKNYMDVTVNDVIVGATQAGLYRYLNRRY
nr:O-acyltransferase WSD1-like [Tanacetum cinerariifolium]